MGKMKRLYSLKQDLEKVYEITNEVWKRQQGKNLFDEDLILLKTEFNFLIEFIDTYCCWEQPLLRKEFKEHAKGNQGTTSKDG